MIVPIKSDGSPISVLQSNGRVYVDIPAPHQQYMNTRGGPDYPHHHHRFEEYGLVDPMGLPLVRCRMCALVEIDEYSDEFQRIETDKGG